MAQDHDRFNLKPHFEECANFIDKALTSKGRIYVHCYRGVSRSTSAIIAYLMKIKGMDFKAAKNLCRVKRPIVNPNSGFIRQLIEYSYDLMKVNREAELKRNEVLGSFSKESDYVKSSSMPKNYTMYNNYFTPNNYKKLANQMTYAKKNSSTMSSPKNDFFARVKNTKDYDKYDHTAELDKTAILFNLKSRESASNSPNNFMKKFQSDNKKMDLTSSTFYKTNQWESYISPNAKLQVGAQNKNLDRKLKNDPAFTSSFANVFDRSDNYKFNRDSLLETSCISANKKYRNYTAGVSKYLKDHEHFQQKDDINSYISPTKTSSNINMN